MHKQATYWVSHSFHLWRGSKTDLNILEIGSLDINGSVRPIFLPYQLTYLGIDPQEGPGVDLVTDASTFVTGPKFDVVVCAEVFEHTAVWRDIIDRTYDNLVDGGLFIATMAGIGRHPHSAIDENPIRDWEYYENVSYSDLSSALVKFKEFKVNVLGNDTRCWATKGNKLTNIEKEVK